MNESERNVWEEQEPEELKMALQNIRSKPLPAESLHRALADAENISMTAEAWKRGILNACLVGVPMFLLTGTVVYVLTAQFGVSRIDAGFGIGLIALYTGFGWMLINYFRQRAQVGRVLIDCGRTPGFAIFLFQILFMGGLAVSSLPNGLSPNNFLKPIFFGSFSFFCIIIASSRLEFCEGGIKLHHALLPWNKIKSYEWKEGKNPTLLVQTDSLLAWYIGAYPIPDKYRDEIDKLLQQYVTHVSCD